MKNETLEIKRTPEGAIDTQHYARKAIADRRAARADTMRKAGRGSRRLLIALLAFIGFWNIPPMGGVGPKEMPYR